MPSTFNEVIAIAKSKKEKKICVVNAHDDDVLKSITEANRLGFASAILVGNQEKILAIAKEENLDISPFEIHDVQDFENAAAAAVRLIREKKADILMKGKIQTPDLMRAVLHKDHGLRASDLLSHVGVFQSPDYHKLLFVTDGGLNISPDLSKKIAILYNALKLTQSLGIVKPKVAGLAAIELVNPDMPATLDAALLTMMNKRGQLKDCIFDGPLAMDNAISSLAAKAKGIDSPVAGEVDILLVPGIEAGNILVKALTYLAGCTWGGVIVGAKCPIVLVSRADSYEAKLNSIALAVAMSE